jgi:hypothetical protein
MVEPRYLKLWVNWTNWLFGRVIGREGIFGNQFFGILKEVGEAHVLCFGFGVVMSHMHLHS